MLVRVGWLWGLGVMTAWGNTGPERVLFVGNSYTAFSGPDSLEASYAQLLAERSSSETEAVVSKHTVGGATLSMHLESAQNGALKSVLEEGWDIVVLQDQSQIPGFPKSNAEWRASRDAAVELARLAESVGAETRLFVTWGREQGDSQNAERYADYSAMQQLLIQGYQAYADAIEEAGFSVELVGVGEVWQSIHDAIASEGINPAEGDTLFTRLYLNDGSHPSPAGTYLAATSFYAALTGDSPVGLVWAHQGITEEDRNAIQLASAGLLPDEPVEPDPEELPEDTAETGNGDAQPDLESASCGCQTTDAPGSLGWMCGVLMLAALGSRRTAGSISRAGQ